jgi:hypothetical protein
VRGDDQGAWLLLHVFGEQRGTVGNGPLGWGLAAMDSLAGRRNNYYLLSVLIPIHAGELATERGIVLTDFLFSRLTAWYAQSGVSQPILNNTEMRTGQHLNG